MVELGQPFGALIYNTESRGMKPSQLTLGRPGPVVTVIERRCIYKVPRSATPLIPVNLRRSWKEKCHKPRTWQGTLLPLPAGNWGIRVSWIVFPAVTPFGYCLTSSLKTRQWEGWGTNKREAKKVIIPWLT